MDQKSAVNVIENVVQKIGKGSRLKAGSDGSILITGVMQGLQPTIRISTNGKTEFGYADVGSRIVGKEIVTSIKNWKAK